MVDIHLHDLGKVWQVMPHFFSFVTCCWVCSFPEKEKKNGTRSYWTCRRGFIALSMLSFLSLLQWRKRQLLQHDAVSTRGSRSCRFGKFETQKQRYAYIWVAVQAEFLETTKRVMSLLIGAWWHDLGTISTLDLLSVCACFQWHCWEFFLKKQISMHENQGKLFWEFWYAWRVRTLSPVVSCGQKFPQTYGRRARATMLPLLCGFRTQNTENTQLTKETKNLLFPLLAFAGQYDLSCTSNRASISFRWIGQLHVSNCWSPGRWHVCRSHGVAVVSENHWGWVSRERNDLHAKRSRRSGRSIRLAETREGKCWRLCPWRQL